MDHTHFGYARQGELLAKAYRDSATAVRDLRLNIPSMRSNISSVEKYESCLLSFKQLIENYSLLSQMDADNLLYSDVEDTITGNRKMYGDSETGHGR